MSRFIECSCLIDLKSISSNSDQILIYYLFIESMLRYFFRFSWDFENLLKMMKHLFF